MANPNDTRLSKKFRAKFYVAESGCWLWVAGTSSGYGRFYLNPRRRATRAHRVAYEALIGPIPDGLTIDHLCRVRHCVNPSHMEPVTSRENTLRGNGPTAVHARQTYCRRGHEFTFENTYMEGRNKKRRRCRICSNIKTAKWKKEKWLNAL